MDKITLPSDTVEFSLDQTCGTVLSPLLFGDNLEHTRGCIYGGLSAEMLRNRKFTGKPGRYGCAHEWYPIGEKAYFSFGTEGEYLSHGAPYTRHAEGYKMRRFHERNAQYITNYNGLPSGIGQKDIYVSENTEYEFCIAARSNFKTVITVALMSHDREVYDSKKITVYCDDYREETVLLRSAHEDFEARLEITFDEQSTLMIGAVSLMPNNNFHGMRTDVVERIKELGIRLLRWPGGNFAGEYNWKDGLLPRNMRAPFQSYLMLETQPHTSGYDFHEINTDDFIALCREIGAEPFITLNPTWNTPEESSEWVEYCNGSADTPYGALRAERGHPEPYNVRFWSLGNEAGYGHMEGANTADAYAKAVRKHAEEMLKVSPDIVLCSSGPYPNQEWVDYSVKPLSDIAKVVSLHRYTEYPKYFDPEKRKEEYNSFISQASNENLECIRRFRDQLGNLPVFISFDEWNAWYAWYRPGSVSEGIFAAAFMNMIFSNAADLGVMIACHFESVNEGAIKVYPDKAELSPVGQVFSLIKKHAEGKICCLQTDVTATEKDGIVTCTLLNRSYDKDKKYIIRNCGNVISAAVYSSDDVVPGSTFTKETLNYNVTTDGTETVLPPHSIAQIQFEISQ